MSGAGPIGGGPSGQGGAGEAARQLEAYFLRQVLSTMPKGALFGGDGAAASTIHGMFTEVLADAVAEGGDVGLAAELQHALEGSEPRQLPPPTATFDPERLADEISATRSRDVQSSIDLPENGVGE
jgi:Rod binding domain-containing protein